ncbi:hypothetical protein, partial, partial [Parasitella parasitica]
ARPPFWEPRRAGFDKIIGRMYTVSPKDIEKFHLRMLSMHVPGATSFQDNRTSEGEVHPTFQAAARARGPLEDDTEWSALDHRDSITEYYLHSYQQIRNHATAPLFAISEKMYGHCLLDLNDILADHLYDIRFMEGFHTVFPATDTSKSGNARHSNTFERMHNLMYAEALGADDPGFLPFNESQALVYNTIREAALEENPVLGPRIYFIIDGPGGTGKTFVFNALLDRVRM